jgi:type IV pilus assembly protein PilB
MLELGSIDPDQLIEALQHQKENPTEEGAAQLGQVLLNMGKIDETALAAALAFQFGIPLADLTHEKPAQDALDIVGEDLARQHVVIPLRIENERVFMAIADPLDTQAIDDLTRKCKRIGLLMGTRSEIERLLDESFNVLHQAHDAIRAFELTDVDDLARDQANDNFEVDDNAPIIQVANRIITQGVRSRASDVHIEPGENYVRVRYRVDGAMAEAIQLPSRMAPALASRVKVMAGLNIVERRRPQDGQFGVTVDGRPIDIRISTVATVHGEKIVLRLLDKTKSLISLKDLGMHPQVQAPYLKIVKSPLGMLLCTGPTGSGKTTTLYSCLRELNTIEDKLLTAEDPVEYDLEGIVQVPVKEAIGMTFARALKAFLRQDPDRIMIGEIRDLETASMSVQASLTGHLVLSTLHTNDAPGAVTRLIDMGVEPFLITSTLEGVLAQRLVRRVCKGCREEYDPTDDELQALSLTRADVGDHKFAYGKGCPDCNDTGYKGRKGLFELFVASIPIKMLINRKEPAAVLFRKAREEGMRTLREAGVASVLSGETTVEEILKYT